MADKSVRGMYTCGVCGRDFPLISEEHYISKDPEATGLSALVNNTVLLYDAIDCPHCGCQNVLQKRKPFACPCDYGICDECDYTEEEGIDEEDNNNGE